jgi:hypothetical protein
MRTPWVVLTGLAVAAVGCEAPPSQLESVRLPIIAGAVHTGDPAIMELLSFQGNLGARCTATLIAPNLLIAAAHCITETPGFKRYVYPGNDDRNVPEKDMLAVKAVIPNPAYRGAPRQGNDFCIIVLEKPLDIRPVPLNRAAVEQVQGKTVRYVGYGLVTIGNPQSGGIKRQNTQPLAAVTRLLLSIAPNAHPLCEGDSGGPLLFDDGKGESIIGIASFVENPACQRGSFYQRVDTQLAWIDEQIMKLQVAGPAPGADAGASAADAAPPVSPDASAPDPVTPPAADARPAADSAPSKPAPTPDARVEPEPEPEPVHPTTGASGGCRYAGGAARDAAALPGLLLVLAWAARRARRRPDPE